MKRYFVLILLAMYGSGQPEVRAQNAPAISSMRLEDFLIEAGQRFGIVIESAEPLDEFISVPKSQMTETALLSAALSRHSYVLVYSKPWHGPLAESPNWLHVFARNRGSEMRSLNAIPETVGEVVPVPLAADAIARVDSLVQSFGDDRVHLASALALEIATSSDVEVREEAVYALADIDLQFAEDALMQALGDESAAVREAAVMAIADSDFPEMNAMLRLALTDASAVVREAAADALKRRE